MSLVALLMILALEPPPELQARVADAATTADGANLAYYLDPQTADDPRAEGALVVEHGERRLTLPTPLRMRALTFVDEDTLYLLAHKPTRKGAEGALYLHRATGEDGEIRLERLLRVPPGTRDMTLWSEERALLLAAPDQIRSILLDSLRSGPLFAVRGANNAIASLGGNSSVLVGQDDALLLVELTDRPTREGHPVRERVSVAAPIVSLRSSEDGRSARAELADGQTLEIDPSPLTIRPGGAGSVLATALARPASRLWPRSTREPPPAPEIVETTPSDPPPPPETKAEPTPRIERSEKKPAPPPKPEPSRVEAPPKPEPEPEPTPVPVPAEASLYGRIVGPAADRAVAVVVYGPNNILREAARVPVGGDGSWSAGGLEPGRYRVQVDGGGGTVLATTPPFRTATVGEAPVAVEPIEVVRAL